MTLIIPSRKLARGRFRAGASAGLDISSANIARWDFTDPGVTYNAGTGQFAGGVGNACSTPWPSDVSLVACPLGLYPQVARINFAQSLVPPYEVDRGVFIAAGNLPALGSELYWAGEYLIPAGVYDVASGPGPYEQRKLMYHKLTPDFATYGARGYLVPLRRAGSLESNAKRINLDGSTAVGIPPESGALAPLSIGEYHVLETGIRMNTAQSADDGEVWVWLDGVLVGHGTNVRMTDPAYGVSDASWIWYEFGFGNQMQDGDGAQEYRYWSKIAVSTNRIGA